MATANTAPARASRTARGAQPAALSSEPRPAETKATITFEAVPVTYRRPTVVLPNGETIVCQHRYLHETEKAAAACGSRIAAASAFVK